PAKVGQVAKDMLRLVVTSGTGEAAQVGDEAIWGKTGTTENYGDAWFAGGNDDLTVAVWVGYADKTQPMEFEHAGGPVAGGTFPAEIFHDFMAAWIELREARDVDTDDDETGDELTPTTPVDPSAVPEEEQPETTTPGDQAPEDDSGAAPTPDEQEPPETPEVPAPAEPLPAPTQPPSGGGGPGGGAGPGDGATG
ncbi:MAG TPA: penicillin-binding transpeptidase domain-containing protein, partial [Kofleriaceae bacterium]|nr:penicillin-binding transpeptidase domain-containing protein [Kofleriaceae bacterium]